MGAGYSASSYMCGDDWPGQPGDHLVIARCGGAYTHHGIDVGSRVVHYATSLHDISSGLSAVRSDTRRNFAKGAQVAVRKYGGDAAVQDREVVVGRALAALGTGGYNPLYQNCEHFATYCKTGRSESAQVLHAVESLRRLLSVPTAEQQPGPTMQSGKLTQGEPPAVAAACASRSRCGGLPERTLDFVKEALAWGTSKSIEACAEAVQHRAQLSAQAFANSWPRAVANESDALSRLDQFGMDEETAKVRPAHICARIRPHLPCRVSRLCMLAPIRSLPWLCCMLHAACCVACSRWLRCIALITLLAARSSRMKADGSQ